MATPRQLILDLLMRDKTGPASKSGADNLKTVGDAAADAAADTEKLGKQSDKTEDQVEKLGKSARTAAEHVDRLDREIESVERELKQLAVAFAEAESAAERLDLSKAIRRTEADLRKLKKSKLSVESLIPADLGKKVGTSLSKDILDGLGSVKGPLAAGLGVALAPTIGSAIAAAVIGGVGLGGIIGGVALVADNPEIKAAGQRVGQRFVTGVNAEAEQSFVKPVKEALDDVEALAERSVPKIGKIFEATAPSADGLTKSVIRASDALLDSLVHAAQRSAPVMSSLGDVIGDTGESVGELISTLADHSDEAASSLDDLNAGLQGVIGTATVVVDTLGTVRGALDSVEEWAKKNEFLGAVFEAFKTQLMGPLPVLGELINGLKGTEEATKGTADATNDAAPQVKTLSLAMTTAAEAADRQREAQLQLNNQIRAETDPLFAFVEAQNKVREAQDKVTEAIKRYGPKSAQAAAATRGLTSAAVDLHSRATAVGVAADGKLTPALHRALVQAGLTKSEIARVKTQLKQAKQALDAYDGTKANATVTLTYAYVNKANLGKQGPQIERRAAGGPVRAGVPYIVGERRAEMFVPESNGRIVPSVGQYAASSMGSGGSGGSGGWVVVRGDAIIDALTVAIASRVSAKGGRPAQLGIRFG